MKWVIVLLLILVANYCYIRLPDGAAESNKQRIPALMLRIMDDVATIGSFFGFSKFDVLKICTNSVLLAAKAFHPKSLDVETSDRSFDGIPVRIYTPKTTSKKPRPAVVFIHGGGWTLLSVDGYDPFTRDLAKESGSIILSVDYRLAPEHIFPAAFDDCVKATKYFLNNAAVFGADPTKVGIVGDSAGGNLAMAVSLKLGKEQFKPELNFQGLIYPALQAMDYNLSSYREFDFSMRNTYTPVTKIAMVTYYNLYGFGDLRYLSYFWNNTHTTRAFKTKYRRMVDPSVLSGKNKVQPDDFNSQENIKVASEIENVISNPYFAPLMATDEELKLLPKTYLLTAEYDGLRDEGMILGYRLRKINHSLVYKHWDGMEHGFMIFSFYDSYREGIDHLSSYIKDIS